MTISIQRYCAVEQGWILKAGITVAENATLYINSTDTSWLKIIADEETAYPVRVSGSLKIDSVRISSWNDNTNNYTSSLDSHSGSGIEVDEDSTEAITIQCQLH